MALEDGLDLGRRDVLAAGHDRVRLAADDVQDRRRRSTRRGRRCASTGPAPGATVGPLTRISPSSARRTPVQNSGAPTGRHLRARLGQAVGRARPGRRARPRGRASAGGTARRRAAPSAGRGGSRSPASSRRWSVVGTSETIVAPPSGRPSSSRTRSVSKRSWTIAVVAVDRAAQDDRQPADVRQRQRAEPALRGVQAERDARPERAPQPVAVGQLDRLRPPARPRRVDDDRDRVEVVPALEADVGLVAVDRPVDDERRAARDARGAPRPPSRTSIGTATAPSSRQACSATRTPRRAAARSPRGRRRRRRGRRAGAPSARPPAAAARRSGG